MEQGEQWRVALEASCSEGPIAAEKVIKELKSSDQCLEVRRGGLMFRAYVCDCSCCGSCVNTSSKPRSLRAKRRVFRHPQYHRNPNFRRPQLKSVVPYHSGRDTDEERRAQGETVHRVAAFEPCFAAAAM